MDIKESVDNGQPLPIFNAIQDTYDNIKGTKGAAERLPTYAKISPEHLILDVACGTGWSTNIAAKALESNGRIIGIDIADKLLDIARKKAASAGLSNVEYHIGNAEDLKFNDSSFDRVMCSLSIFFFRDIFKVLSEWNRVLKPGGIIAFSSFGETFLQPMITLLYDKLAYYEGQQGPEQQALAAANTPEKCRKLLLDAGFNEIEVNEEQMGFYLPEITSYWQEITSTIVRLRLERLGPERLKRFTEEHLADVESLITNKGIWIDNPIIFAVAKK
jgi:ubiquinone/menaquinone biosynthesis C-methylase UbiE